MKVFFDYLREKLFRGKLTQDQVEGIQRIVEYRDARYPTMSDHQLAYVLATVYHETAHTMQPVSETRTIPA